MPNSTHFNLDHVCPWVNLRSSRRFVERIQPRYIAEIPGTTLAACGAVDTLKDDSDAVKIWSLHETWKAALHGVLSWRCMCFEFIRTNQTHDDWIASPLF